MGPSSPYYLFGAQRRYAYAWHGNAGGVPQGHRAAETRDLGLGMSDLVESGLDRNFVPYQTFGKTHAHAPRVGGPVVLEGSVSCPTFTATGDWPLWRPSGPEPHDPNGDGLGIFDSLSDNEKKLAAIGAIAAVGFYLYKRRKKRRR